MAESKFIIKKEYMLGGMVDKGEVNLYTLVNLPKYDTNLVAIGRKVEGLTERCTVVAEIELRVETKRLYAKNEKTGQYELGYYDVTKTFIRNIEKVE